MAPNSDLIFRLRRFRVVLVTIVVLPWLMALALTPFVRWYSPLGWTAFRLVVDGSLLFFAWRNPSGLAPMWIVLRLLAGAVAGFVLGHSAVPYATSALAIIEAAVLVWLLLPMWRVLRGEHLDAQLERVEQTYARDDRRQAVKRQARIERNGYR